MGGRNLGKSKSNGMVATRSLEDSSTSESDNNDAEEKNGPVSIDLSDFDHKDYVDFNHSDGKTNVVINNGTHEYSYEHSGNASHVTVNGKEYVISDHPEEWTWWIWAIVGVAGFILLCFLWKCCC